MRIAPNLAVVAVLVPLVGSSCTSCKPKSVEARTLNELGAKTKEEHGFQIVDFVPQSSGSATIAISIDKRRVKSIRLFGMYYSCGMGGWHLSGGAFGQKPQATRKTGPSSELLTFEYPSGAMPFVQSRGSVSGKPCKIEMTIELKRAGKKPLTLKVICSECVVKGKLNQQ